jgi:murein endopeptidase
VARALSAAALLTAAYAPAAAAQLPPPDDRPVAKVHTLAPPVDAGPPPVLMPHVGWQDSRAVGMPWAGRLVRGVQLPAEGPDWFSWDGVLDRAPDRGWRRWGTDALLRTVFHVLREYRDAHPAAPRVGIGDLSRTHGGPFGAEFGGLGHASHQNGLDVDVWYPRVDGHERRPFRVAQVDRRLAQDLVDRFVAAGAEKVFVGPHVDLHGPRDVVVPLVYHDDHLHVRIPKPPR